MSFSVRLTHEALEDLERLEAFLVELALRHGDFDLPLRAVDAIRRELRILETNPYTCRKVGPNPLERELVIPFGSSGYVALFEIISESEVVVSAIRHQREDDYH
ncbi:MAG: type II toxin-antitoxin system RelE/ParE family toxin [Burkholderiales bacterium]|nr:type II toxin-antitoxin system RelE/ParE family toxin [Burkholderiales bacterium]